MIGRVRCTFYFTFAADAEKISPFSRLVQRVISTCYGGVLIQRMANGEWRMMLCKFGSG